MFESSQKFLLDFLLIWGRYRCVAAPNHDSSNHFRFVDVCLKYNAQLEEAIQLLHQVNLAVDLFLKCVSFY